jgi:hypothetical protein
VNEIGSESCQLAMLKLRILFQRVTCWPSAPMPCFSERDMGLSMRSVVPVS